MTQAAVAINEVLMTEVWRPVSGSVYEVSDLGRVRRGQRILKPRNHTNGYLRVILCEEAVRKDAYVHRLVCAAFHGPAPTDAHADHINGNRQDNRSENVRWSTPEANRARRRFASGATHPNAKLDNAAVLIIRTSPYRRGQDASLAQRFGVTRETVRDIRLGKAWRASDVAR